MLETRIAKLTNRRPFQRSQGSRQTREKSVKTAKMKLKGFRNSAALCLFDEVQWKRSSLSSLSAANESSNHQTSTSSFVGEKKKCAKALFADVRARSWVCIGDTACIFEFACA